MKKYFLMMMSVVCASLFVGCEDNDDDIKNLSKEVKEFISQKYPNARILEYDNERTYIEVDIMDGNIKKDVTFTKSNEWLSTHWDILVSSLPKEVTESVKAKYPSLILDDADFYETPQGNFYQIELEPGDIEIRVKPDGEILK